MAWTLKPAGSWTQASGTVPADVVTALALPGSWRWYPLGWLLVRNDQVANLPAEP
jgi:hypothetical protein